MSYFVLTFPKISADDLAWIQTIRQEHDPNFELVAAHFTLVFGVDVVMAQLQAHMQTITQRVRAFSFVARCTVVVKDSFSPNYHLFLVPDEGFSNLVKLHDMLYTAVLAPVLQLDIPYIPHITIAASPHAQKMKRLADELNQQSVCIAGKIEAVSLVQLNAEQLHTIATVTLPAPK